LEKLVKRLEDISLTNSSHNGVYKKIFFTQEFFESNITQVAYSKLQAGEEIAIHYHESMDEVFFLTEGICEFNIDNETYLAQCQSVIRIIAKMRHSLRAITNCNFYYLGVSI
jgi:mannose-6-phosphate isomerase-like protein (cupin superfamily)